MCELFQKSQKKKLSLLSFEINFNIRLISSSIDSLLYGTGGSIIVLTMFKNY